MVPEGRLSRAAALCSVGGVSTTHAGTPPSQSYCEPMEDLLRGRCSGQQRLHVHPGRGQSAAAAHLEPWRVLRRARAQRHGNALSWRNDFAVAELVGVDDQPLPMPGVTARPRVVVESDRRVVERALAVRMALPQGSPASPQKGVAVMPASSARRSRAVASALAVTGPAFAVAEQAAWRFDS
jgi:hypothetical protein